MGGNDWEPGDADMNKNCRNDFVVISMNLRRKKKLGLLNVLVGVSGKNIRRDM